MLLKYGTWISRARVKKPEKPVVADKLSRSTFNHFHITGRVGLVTIYTTEKTVGQRLCKWEAKVSDGGGVSSVRTVHLSFTVLIKKPSLLREPRKKST